MGIWTAAKVLRAPMKSFDEIAVATASLAATLVNPYGIGLWRFLWETVGTSRPDIADWTPAAEGGAPLLIPWFLLCSLLRAVAARKTGIPISAVVIVAVLAIGTLRVGRLDAFLALSVVMFLGPLFGCPLERIETRTRDATWFPPEWFSCYSSLGPALAARSSCLDMPAWLYPEPEAQPFERQSDVS
jgi:hypothetical protein